MNLKLPDDCDSVFNPKQKSCVIYRCFEQQLIDAIHIEFV